MKQEYAFSERRACGLVMLAVSSYRYETRRSDEPLRSKLVELAREKPRFGYRRLQVLLRRRGEQVNHKRLHRVYREAGLMIRRKKRKHCVRVGQALRAWRSSDVQTNTGTTRIPQVSYMCIKGASSARLTICTALVR